MMRYNWSIILFTGIFLSIAFAASAQSSGTIAGTIKQQNGEVLVGATIQLLKADSSLYKTAISDKSGNFEMEYQDALPFILKISMIGYIDHYLSVSDSKPIKIANPIIIQLEALPVSMKAIVVQAKKPLVEMKADRLVVNVDASPGNAGNNVLEVLEKAPGVAVDKDGNISLKGKQAVLVLIDGRPTYLTPADLANYLKSLPASAIDQLELMTNPPAKFDAAGNAGVINIKTKKSKTQGFNGTYSGSVGQGLYNRNSNSLQLNYRKNKINVFANSNYSNWEGFNNLDIERIFKNDNKEIQAIFKQFSKERSDQRDNTNLKLGMDYQLNSKTNLGIVVSGFSNPETIAFNNNTQLNNKFNAIDSIVQSTNDLYNRWKNLSGNIYMQHKIDSLGKEITFDLDLSQFGSEGGSLLKNNNYGADNIFKNGNTLRGDFPVDISILSAKTDYTHPLKNNAKLEGGLKSSFVRTNNAANFFNVINGGDQIDFDKTNTFTYRENINAAYINYNKQWKKWGLQMGLRAEHTDVQGDQKGNAQRNDSSFIRSYLNLFPTTYLSYQADDKHQFSLNYGRRIDRPDYQSLNPFVFFIDNYTYQAGNPFLQPQLTSNVELSHLFKGFLTTTLNYSKTNGVFAQSFTQKDFATIVSQSNVGTRTNMGIAINAQLETKKVFSSNIYLNYSHDSFQGEVNGDPLDNKINMLLVSVNNQFKFKKGWSAELSGWYRTKGIEGQIVVSPLSQVTLAAQKQILKNKGTLKLGIRDLFYTNAPKGTINFSNTAATFANRRDSRIITLGFFYRFGKNFKPVVKTTGSSDDVKDRVKKKEN